MGRTAQGWRAEYDPKYRVGLVAADTGKLSNKAFVVVRKLFNEHDHPRGADGRWIDKNGTVKWKDTSGLWRRATVTALKGHGVVEVEEPNGTRSLHNANTLFGAQAKKATLSLKGWIKEPNSQGGSNEGARYEDPNGQKWYAKTPHTPEHVKNEVLAHHLYAAVGVPVPEVTTTPDGKMFVTKLEDSVAWGSLPYDGEHDRVMSDIRKNFVVDAWLANWDGPVNDNLRVTRDGVPLRVDTGGALDFRAQGAPKKLTANVTEISTLLDPNVSYSGSRMYAGITQDEKEDGLKRILALSPDAIREIVKDNGRPAKTADDLIARRAWLATHFGFQLPETTSAGKALLAQQNSSNAGTAPVSLAPAVKKLSNGQAQPLAPGSPVWLKNKSKYGKGFGDLWTIQSVSDDKSSAVLKAQRGGHIVTADPADFQLLRSNYASEASIYASGQKPEMGDTVETPKGDIGKVIDIFPMYLKIEFADGSKKTVASKDLKQNNPLPDTGKPGLYNKPYSDAYSDMQSKYRAIAEAQVRAGDAPKQKFATKDLVPTQPEDATNKAGSGAGAKDLDPIVVRVGGVNYLIDGHHRAAASTDHMLDAHFVDIDANSANAQTNAATPTALPEGKPFDFTGHDFAAHAHPMVYSLSHEQKTAVWDVDMASGTASVIIGNKVAIVKLDRLRDPKTIDIDERLKAKAAQEAAKAAAKAVKPKVPKIPWQTKLQNEINAMTAADAKALAPEKIKPPKYAYPGDHDKFTLHPGEQLYKIDGTIWKTTPTGEAYRLGAANQGAKSYSGDANASVPNQFIQSMVQSQYYGGIQNITPPRFVKAAELLNATHFNTKPLQRLDGEVTSDLYMGWNTPTPMMKWPAEVQNLSPAEVKSADIQPFNVGQRYMQDDGTEASEDQAFIRVGDNFYNYGSKTNFNPTGTKLTDAQRDFYFEYTSKTDYYGKQVEYWRRRSHPDGTTATSAQAMKSSTGKDYLALPDTNSYYTKSFDRNYDANRVLDAVQTAAEFEPGGSHWHLQAKSVGSTIVPIKTTAPAGTGIVVAPGQVLPGFSNPYTEKKLTPSEALNWKNPMSSEHLLSGALDDELLEITKRYDEESTYTDGLYKASDGTLHVDPAMYDLVKEYGGDANAVLLTAEQFDAYVSKNGVPNMYRGVKKASEKKDLQQGTHFVGHGVYGNGTYTGDQAYTASSYGKAVTQLTHKKDTVVKQYSDVIQQQLKDIQVSSEARLDAMAAEGLTPDTATIKSSKATNSTHETEIADHEASALKTVNLNYGPNAIYGSSNDAVQKKNLELASAAVAEHASMLRGLSNFYGARDEVKGEVKNIRFYAGLLESTFTVVNKSDGNEHNIVIRSTTGGHKLMQRIEDANTLAMPTFIDFSPNTPYSNKSGLNSTSAIHKPERLSATKNFAAVQGKTLDDDSDVNKLTARLMFLQDPVHAAFLQGVDVYAVPQSKYENYYVFTNRNAMIIKEGKP